MPTIRSEAAAQDSFQLWWASPLHARTREVWDVKNQKSADRKPNADEWRNIFEAFGRIDNITIGQQLVVRHVTALFTGEGSKHVKDQDAIEHGR